MKLVFFLCSALIGMTACNSDTQSADPHSKPLVKRASFATNGQPPLGTIIASVLPFASLCQDLGESTTYNRTTSTYAPCDRRTIQGSRLDLLTRGNSRQWLYAPDLRGKFLRALNNFDPTVPFPQVDQLGDPAGADRQPGDFQADEIKRHTHNAQGILPDNVCMSNGTRDADTDDEKFNADPTAKKPRISVIVDETGGRENRPRNSAVYYYIRIN